MKIPKRFNLLGHTYTVSFCSGDYYNYKQLASSSFEGKWIRITPKDANHPVTKTSIEHSFLHEVIHQILYYTEQSKTLNDNEAFVDNFAGLLHQALTSMEYEDVKGKGEKL